MKKLFSILIYALFILTADGQNVQKRVQAIQILPTQNFYLNGGAKAMFGGKSRISFTIPLPNNTIIWYYSYTIKKSENGADFIHLLAQLTKLQDPTGISAVATEAILTPAGDAYCDIYFMNKANNDLFLDKQDLKFGSFYSNPNLSRPNAIQGTVPVKNILKGTVYLGFKNPNTTSGINVTLEVVALVDVSVNK